MSLFFGRRLFPCVCPAPPLECTAADVPRKGRGPHSTPGPAPSTSAPQTSWRLPATAPATGSPATAPATGSSGGGGASSVPTPPGAAGDSPPSGSSAAGSPPTRHRVVDQGAVVDRAVDRPRTHKAAPMVKVAKVCIGSDVAGSMAGTGDHRQRMYSPPYWAGESACTQLTRTLPCSRNVASRGGALTPMCVRATASPYVCECVCVPMPVCVSVCVLLLLLLLLLQVQSAHLAGLVVQGPTTTRHPPRSCSAPRFLITSSGRGTLGSGNAARWGWATFVARGCCLSCSWKTVPLQALAPAPSPRRVQDPCGWRCLEDGVIRHQ
jgi:hypothetical protein